MTDNVCLTDEQLVERAVHNATQKGQPKWGAVRNVFGFGSTLAKELCERFGFDPHAPADTAESDDPWRAARGLTTPSVAVGSDAAVSDEQLPQAPRA